MSDAPLQFGQYELTARLALGGMAELFLARRSGVHDFEKRLVIKRILPNLAKDPQFTEMFISEAKLTANLSHPKIAQTYELGQTNGQLYIAMEYVDGLDVLAILREFAHRRTRIPTEVSVFIAKEALDALDFAHKQVDDRGKLLGIVHRDVSPSNILVSRRGDVKLVDFGIAHAVDTKEGGATLKGKYGYMSPEQVRGERVSPRSDVFAAGVVLSEMLMGRRLFAAPNELDVLLMVRDARLERLDRFGQEIDGRLDALIRKAMQKESERRFPDAAAFRDALDEWLFDARKRVTAAQLASVVSEVHEDAMGRRHDQLLKSVVEQPEQVIPEPAPAEVRADPIDDIQLASRDMFDTITSEYQPIRSAVDEPSIDAVIERLGLHEPSDEPAESVQNGTPDRDLGFEDLSLDDDIGLSVDEELDLGLEEEPEDGAVPLDSREDLLLSDRYPSISAAVAAIALPGPDPASRDFDESEVSDDGGGHTGVSKKAVRRRPSLADVAAASPPRAPQLAEVDGTPTRSGDFVSTPPIQVLYELTVSKATGLLVATIGGIRKEIYYRAGVPEFVSSNVAGELLGAYLVAQGCVSAAELDMALAMIPHYRGKLGDTLVGLGLMRPLDVFRQLTRQVEAKLVDVCTWEKGTFTWFEGRENPREAFPLDLDAYKVLGAGAMSLPAGRVARWFERFKALRPRSVRNGEVSPESFDAGTIVRQVYDMIDGRNTIATLAARFDEGEPRLAFLRTLVLLLSVGLAHDVIE